MPRTYPLEITLEDVTEETVDQIAGEIEDAIENIRKYHRGPITRTEDVDIDELLAEHGAAAVVWTVEDVRKIVRRLDDGQALAVIRECFRSFAPEETENRDMIFNVADRLNPMVSREQRCRQADKTINDYSTGDFRENLVDLLTDVLHWCDDMNEPFEEFCATARVHYDAERNSQPKGDHP